MFIDYYYNDSQLNMNKMEQKRCKMCLKQLLKEEVKCIGPGCDIVLHLRCFDNIGEVINIEKNNFRCKECEKNLQEHVNFLRTKSNFVDSENNAIKVENECLKREMRLLYKHIDVMELLLEQLKHVKNVS